MVQYHMLKLYRQPRSGLTLLRHRTQAEIAATGGQDCRIQVSKSFSLLLPDHKCREVVVGAKAPNMADYHVSDVRRPTPLSPQKYPAMPFYDELDFLSYDKTSKFDVAELARSLLSRRLTEFHRQTRLLLRVSASQRLHRI